MKPFVPILIVFMLLLSGNKVFAQADKGNISEIIKTKAKQNGTALIHREGDSIRLYATYKNKSLENLYALNKKGNKYNLIYKPAEISQAKEKGAISTEPIKCIVCITRPDGTAIQCWDIKCSDIPKKSISQ